MNSYAGSSKSGVSIFLCFVVCLCAKGEVDHPEGIKLHPPHLHPPRLETPDMPEMPQPPPMPPASHVGSGGGGGGGGKHICPHPSVSPAMHMSCLEISPIAMRCKGTCMEGFNFPDGTAGMTLKCKKGIWEPSDTFPPCKLIESCNFKHQQFNGPWNCSTIDRQWVCSVECYKGFVLPPEAPTSYKCQDGQWIPSEIIYCDMEDKRK